MTYNVFELGALGLGSDDTNAIQEAINQCHLAGGGRVLFPSGKEFISGPLNMRSHVELFFEPNSTLRASTDRTLYNKSAFRNNRSEGSMWLYGEDLENFSICGTGTIDGMGTSFMERENKTHFDYSMIDGVDMRPHLLTLIGCRNVTIQDVTFKNSAYWCIHPIGCEDVLISGVRILNSLKVRNCDGIDPDHSRNVRISDCYIESADDCICIKNRREYQEYGTTENITVTGCILVSTSCAIKIGSENVTGIRNVTFSSIIIRCSNRGLGIQNRDEGFVEDVTFDNIQIESRHFADVWWGKAEPISITALPREYNAFRTGGLPEQTPVGMVKNIFFHNITARAENGIYACGSSEARPKNIVFNNVRLKVSKWSKYDGGFYDHRPCEGDGLVRTNTAGFHIRMCDDISITDSFIEWGDCCPEYFGKALELKDVGVRTISRLFERNRDGETVEVGNTAVDRKNPLFSTDI